MFFNLWLLADYIEEIINVVVDVFLNTLLSHHHYFPKALVEDSHISEGIYSFSDGLATFPVYYKEKLLKTWLVVSVILENEMVRVLVRIDEAERRCDVCCNRLNQRCFLMPTHLRPN